MNDFEFVADEALLSNLKRLSVEQSVISEQRVLEISDIVAALADSTLSLMDDGVEMHEALSLFAGSVSFGDYERSDISADENSLYISNSLKTLERSDKTVFADLYIAELKKRNITVKETDFLAEVSGEETFTYVKNAFSDEAYDVFSQDFEDPRLRYSTSFKECADAVSDGEVTYCLLPLEERGGVRLPTVSDLIFRRDFKINSVTPVFGPDGNANMKYALVSKSFTVPMRQSGDDRYLEIRLGAADGVSLSEILSAVDSFSMSVYRVNTVVFDTEGESEVYYSLVIRDDGNDFSRFLTYLVLFGGDFVPVGIYKNLE